MQPFSIFPFPTIAEALLKSKSEFSGSVTIVAIPLFEPLWPFTSGRTGGCRPRSSGRGEGAQLAFGHWTRWSWSFPTPHKPSRAGDGDGKKKNKKGINNRTWFNLYSWPLLWRGAPRKATEEDFCCLFVTSLLSQVYTPKFLGPRP